jgi:hypothetical protein
MIRNEQRPFEVQLARKLAEAFHSSRPKDHASTRLKIETVHFKHLLCGPLRISALSALEIIINAENAEIRRGPQISRQFFRAVAGLPAAASDNA